MTLDPTVVVATIERDARDVHASAAGAGAGTRRPPAAATAEGGGCPSSSSPPSGGGGGATVHSLPCTVHHDGGRAAVGVYFHPTAVPPSSSGDADADGVEMMAAQFRGRHLRARGVGGGVLPPDRVAGLVLSSRPTTATARTARGEATVPVMRVEATFSSVMEWGHDRDPTAISSVSSVNKRNFGGGGKVRRAMDWFELSDAVHDPVVIP